MRVVMLSSEAGPYAKTGGLADVLAALPRALAELDVEVTVVLPAYRAALAVAGPVERLARVHAPVSSRMEPVDLLRVAGAPVSTVLVHAPRYFDRAELYGTAAGDFPDNAERFVVFCRAALEWLRTLASPPAILHAHDWQAAVSLAFLRASADLYPELARVRTMQTIHNLAYQGRFWSADWHLLNLDPRFFVPDYLECYGGISFLKAGIVFADAVTTVSPRYAREIQTPSHGEGLDGALRARAHQLHGILNGIDYRVWNPGTDPEIAAPFDVGRMRGKAACRAALQLELGLTPSPEAPLLAVISRLADQKGIDLIVEVAPRLLADDGCQLAVLGSGEARYETALSELAHRHPGRMAVRIGFDEGLAHRIEAGSDVFLMPSRFEPCGLSQMYSLRYGTAPVVHATGGLDDTVAEFDPARGVGTGFKFAPFGSEPFLAAVRRALAIRRDPTAWERLQSNGMNEDFSWERSARAYQVVYDAIAAP